MENYPTINWVTFKGNVNNFFNDYRPAIGPDGKSVIFERTSYNFESRSLVTKLFMIHDLNDPSPQLFLSDCDSPQQTRPAWTGANIALNLEYEDEVSVWTVNVNGSNLQKIENTNNCIYPQWAINLPFEGLVVMRPNEMTGGPQSALFDLNGNMFFDNMNGVDTTNTNIFGGMPSVLPGNLTSIAFAGQTVKTNNASYNQEENYIFFNTEIEAGFISTPMERFANLKHFDKSFQGRAPAISPDGKYIAFESNRDGGYALYLYNSNNPENRPIPLTDPTKKLNAQHPKFFPDGSKLIFSAVHPGYQHSCICWIDITEYL